MRYKESKAYINVIETITSSCPHCGADYKDGDIGWRNKYFNEKTGLAIYPVKCQKKACGKYFKFNFNN